MDKYLNAIKKRSIIYKNRIKNSFQVLFGLQQSSLEKYSNKAPHFQNAIDLFQGEWRSSFPTPFHELKAGETPLFNDAHINWALNELSGIANKKVLELGPLEGGHSYMLQKAGAASIDAVEAHPRAYLKCLIVKEALELNKVKFHFGDFIEYLKNNQNNYDLCLASGVLYHMKNPVELISLIAKCSSQMILWTHYYDPSVLHNSILKRRFSTHQQGQFEGFKYTQHLYRYGSARYWPTFIGGPATTSTWLSQNDILSCCQHFGFKNFKINFDNPHHPHGPCFALMASK